MKRLDTGSLVVMGVTFVLFVVATFEKGLTHDLLLEAGVFLVSVKLIMMAYKNGVVADSIMKQLEEVKAALGQRPDASAGRDAGGDAKR